MSGFKQVFFSQAGFCLPLGQEAFKREEVTQVTLSRILIDCICKFQFLSNRKKHLIGSVVPNEVYWREGK